jgi:DNA ligase 4
LDHIQQLQPAELFKYLFSVELIDAGFDKPANTSYFALQFPQVLKIYRDCLFNNTISFDELQEIAKQYNKVLEDNKRKEIYWLRRLGRYNYIVERSRSSLLSYNSPVSVTEATWVDSQIVVQQQESTNTRLESKK